MGAGAEIEVGIVLARDVKPVGVGELALIAIRAAHEGDERLASLNLLATELDVLQGQARCTLKRPFETEEFFDGAAEQSRVTPQLVHLFGMAQEGEHAITDEIARGFMTRDEDEHALSEKFELGKRISRLDGMHHQAQDVVAWF